ncbi:MAG: hypothetical protein ABIH89_06205 [Elusimicrobiota bacterium]
MKKVIIGIHGLGIKPPKNILKKWWIQSITDGLKATGCRNTAFTFELAYWADVIHKESLDINVTDEKNRLYVKRPYVRPGNIRIDNRPPKLNRTILHRLERGIDKIFFEDHIFVRLDAITNVIMRRLFRDLDAYFHAENSPDSGMDRSSKEIIHERLAELLRKNRKKEILLISHSMGTVVAYDVLLKTKDCDVSMFVTMGSPLGIPVLMKKMAAKDDLNKDKIIATPECITWKWYNFADIDDNVAINSDLASNYRENSKGVSPFDITVKNTYEYKGKRHPHKSFGYLRTPQMARAVSEFLYSGKTGIFNVLSRVFPHEQGHSR